VVTLRDSGIPAACEGDITALLTTMMMSYLSENSAFMGNIVRIDPESNTTMISHDLVPFKMAGLDEDAKPFKLRNFAGTYGVTAYAALDRGQEVTIARMSTDLEEMVALKGKIVDCRDTVLSRITVTVSVNDAREFFHKAPGCHQVVVYGDHLDELKGLCNLLGMKFTTI
jgi:L-fucose isomerase-like protein